MEWVGDRLNQIEIWSGWRAPLDELPFIVLDVETTGLDPQVDRIIELALVTADGVALETLIDPVDALPILGPHGPHQRDVAGAPSFADVMPSVRHLLHGRILVAHWADFDLGFLHAEAERAGEPIVALPYLCTASLADALELGHESRSLSYACRRYGVRLDLPHTARCDAVAAAALFALYAREATALRRDLSALPDVGGVSTAATSWRHPPLGPSPQPLRPSLSVRGGSEGPPLPEVTNAA